MKTEGAPEDPELANEDEEHDPSAPMVLNEAEYVFAEEHVALGVELTHEVAAVGYAAMCALRDLAGIKGLDENQAPLVRELWLALGYELRIAQIGAKPGCDLVGTVGPSPWPADPRTVPTDVVSLWRALADRATDSVIRARFNDLLVVAEAPQSHLHASVAAEHYLASAAGDIDVHDAMKFLIRAWDLARRFGFIPVEEHVVDSLLDLAEFRVDDPSAPGLVLPLLAAASSALAVKRGAFTNSPRRERAIALLERALKTYKRDYLAVEIVDHLRTIEGADDPERNDALDRAVVHASIHEADAAANPAVELICLQRAANAARDRGLSDLREAAVRRMQRVDPESLGLQKISVESHVPRDVMEPFFEQFTRSADWRQGLLTFLHIEPPTGDVDVLRETTKKTNARFVLRSLFSRTSLRSDGLPRFQPTTPEERFEAELAHTAEIRVQTSGRMLAIALDRMRARYGVPAEEDLAQLLAMNGAGDDELAGRLARSLIRHWNEDYEGAVHAAVPIVEAAARALLLVLDEAVYRTQVASSQGGYVGLALLIDQLERLNLDPSWAYFLRWLLVAPTGANVRNEVAHGFAGVDGPTGSALVLRAAAVLVWLVPHDDRVVADRDRVQAELRTLLRAPVEEELRFPPPTRGVARIFLLVSRWLERAAARLTRVSPSATA